MSSSWVQSKTKQQRYLQRRAESSDLYRVVYHAKDELERVWEQRFQSHYGVLREEVKSTLEAYLDCGILVHGAARAACEKCKHSILVAFSCKKRGVCGSCATKRALIFAENLHENILEAVPQRHVVFSIPKRLRVYFRYDRSLHQVLFRAAWESISQLYEELEPGESAAVLSVHTSGDALNHNPHVHGVVADGVFKESGFKPLPKLSTEKLTKLFMHKVLKSLKSRGLITDTVIAQIQCQRHSGFSAWVGEAIEAEDTDARLFVSRYIDKGPVATSKVELDGDIVSYLHDSDFHPAAEFDPLEFLAAVSVQIPNKWEQLTRHYGYYSTRKRGERKKKQEAEQPQELVILEPLPKRKATSTWASLIKKVYNVDPLICSKCGGNMKIVAFITDSREITKIMKHLNVPPYRAPPPIEYATVEQTIEYDPYYYAA